MANKFMQQDTLMGVWGGIHDEAADVTYSTKPDVGVGARADMEVGAGTGEGSGMEFGAGEGAGMETS